MGDGRWQLQLWLLPLLNPPTPTMTLLEPSTHQPDKHALTILSPERARKEFHLVLTGFISYSVNSNIIHGDQSENRN